jgi:hypothetical protein
MQPNDPPPPKAGAAAGYGQVWFHILHVYISYGPLLRVFIHASIHSPTRSFQWGQVAEVDPDYLKWCLGAKAPPPPQEVTAKAKAPPEVGLHTLHPHPLHFRMHTG